MFCLDPVLMNPPPSLVPVHPFLNPKHNNAPCLMTRFTSSWIHCSLAPPSHWCQLTGHVRFWTFDTLSQMHLISPAPACGFEFALIPLKERVEKGMLCVCVCAIMSSHIGPTMSLKKAASYCQLNHSGDVGWEINTQGRGWQHSSCCRHNQDHYTVQPQAIMVRQWCGTLDVWKIPLISDTNKKLKSSGSCEGTRR